MKNNKLIKHILLLLLGIIPIIIVRYYPVVDWVSEPFYTYFIMSPILGIELILFIILILLKRYKSLKWIQIIFNALLFLIMGYYLFVH